MWLTICETVLYWFPESLFQGGVRFPTGGTARDRLLRQPLIRCDSEADGIVRMEETEAVCHACFALPVSLLAGRFCMGFGRTSFPTVAGFQKIFF